MNSSPQRPESKKLAAHFQNEDAARAYLEAIRWPNGPVCPKCGTASKPYALKAGKYRCSDKDCRSDFTVRVGTIFESSHIALHKWLLAAFLLCSSKKGISSHQIHRIMGVTYKTAWFMTHRIREAMKEGSLVSPFGGPDSVVEVDETFIGRDKEYKRKSKQRGYMHKFKVLALVDRTAKRARSIVVESLKAKDIVPILQEHIHPDSQIMTDEALQYKHLRKHFVSHDVVKHSSDEYVRYDNGRKITTNTIEGFFSIFKRGMTGVYQHCSGNHLHRYLAEFDLRYNERGATDSERTEFVLRRTIGRRLMYRTTAGRA